MYVNTSELGDEQIDEVEAGTINRSSTEWIISELVRVFVHLSAISTRAYPSNGEVIECSNKLAKHQVHER